MKAISKDMNRGSVELARRLCVEIAGYVDEDEDIDGLFYGSVDVAEILSAEIVRLRESLREIAEASGFDNIGNWARNHARDALAARNYQR